MISKRQQEEMADAVIEAIRIATAPLLKRIQALEQRPHFEPSGTFSMEATYRRGNVVVDGGSTWLCLSDGLKGVRPGSGTPDGCWQLFAARGRAGRDAAR